MNTRKIIKGYFFFLMFLLSAGSLSYNPSVGSYYANVFDSIDTVGENIINLTKLKITSAEDFQSGIKLTYYTDSSKEFSGINRNQSLITFEIDSNNSDHFAKSGQSDVKVMDFIVKSQSTDLSLKYLKLKLSGVSDESILSAKLSYDGEIISESFVSEGYAEFKLEDFKFFEENFSRITLIVDLNDSLKINDRFKFDIEKSEDLKFIINKELTSIGSYFPIIGKYISIVKVQEIKS